ncbi:MAG TPA: four helix bundle protein [Candidatus Wujingus californicus]|uniref:four helix bundle protein n=1 Tax=Candidatus Wujingus californicus TaxID=3367618 RepID=UPI001DB96787|nr:four helix bundle protein [Planctomycetota bacterium]MDO8131149.1 four helix bundle protein [Candidatus Brocadiales bacterium]
MQSERNSLSERLLDFAADIIKLIVQLNKTVVGRHIGQQLTRSGTSAGANYEEACGAESRADFIHKLQIVLKELRESLYWLYLIKKTTLIVEADSNISILLQEAKGLTNIIAKSIVTAKKRK